MKELMEKISSCKDDVVFVGSLVGSPNETPKDIDIVITSLDGLETIGDVNCFDSISVFAKGAKRCRIHRDGVKIDIWLKDELPEWEIIDGFKYQTKESQLKYYQDVKDSTDDKYIKEYIEQKLTDQSYVIK